MSERFDERLAQQDTDRALGIRRCGGCGTAISSAAEPTDRVLCKPCETNETEAPCLF